MDPSMHQHQNFNVWEELSDDVDDDNQIEPDFFIDRPPSAHY